MNSEIINKLNLSDVDPAYYIIGLLGLCLILLILNLYTNSKLKKVDRRLAKLMRGKNAKSLEELITERFSEVDQLLVNDEQKDRTIEDIQENLKEAYQKLGIVKYDAFNEMGGKLSFALALLNDNNTGFVMNAMHSREGCYTYIKEIINGESYIVLGDEEQQAVEIAMSKNEIE